MVILLTICLPNEILSLRVSEYVRHYWSTWCYRCLKMFLFFYRLLAVIRNTLAVLPEVPVPSVHEGRLVSLCCNITQDFTEGIYLSVTWSIRKDQSVERDLLTFGPDSGVSVGTHFIQRYADGEMRLHLNRTASYCLVLSRAVPADEGTYVCAGKQWTREKGTWNKIQEKSEVIGEVAVIPTGTV